MLDSKCHPLFTFKGIVDQYQSHAINHTISQQEFVDFIMNRGRRIGQEEKLEWPRKYSEG